MDTPETVGSATMRDPINNPPKPRVSVEVDAMNAALDFLGAQTFKDVAGILAALQQTAKVEDGSDIEQARQEGYDRGYGHGANDGRREACPVMYFYLDSSDEKFVFTRDRDVAQQWPTSGVVMDEREVSIG